MNRIPQHRQLSELLKEHILAGQYAPGDLLPSEHALCEVHHVTRPTVRQALSTLVTEGLIRKHKGKGSIVQRPRGGIGILNIVGTTDAMPRGDFHTHVLERPSPQAWPEDFGVELTAVERDSGCIQFSRVRTFDGAPVFYEQTFLPNFNLPRFCQRQLDDQSLFKLLSREYNISVVGGEQRIWAAKPSTAHAKLLCCSIDDPILRLEKRYETSRPNYRFFSHLWCNTSNYYLMGNL